MKILWMNHRDTKHPRTGGAETTIHEIGKRLVKRGHEVVLLTGGYPGYLKREEVDGIVINRLGRRILPHLVHPSFLKEHKDADVIVDDMAHAAPWFSPWFTDIPGVGFFHHLHARTLRGQTALPLAIMLQWLESRYPTIYKSWPFVTESESAMNDLMSLGMPSSRIVRIPPGVDTDAFHPSDKFIEPTIVYFGGFRPYKRPEHSILALKSIVKRGLQARMYVVGGGTSTYQLQLLARRLELSNNVQFTGRLDRASLAALVAKSWVNLHCSQSEGWGFSILEAAAAGTPTVAYKVPGITDSVLDYRTGILAPDGDVESLSLLTEEALVEPYLFSANCRNHSVQFSWDTTASKWESLLKRVGSS